VQYSRAAILSRDKVRTVFPSRELSTEILDRIPDFRLTKKKIEANPQ